MTFKKYFDIENHYREKEIQFFLTKFPELYDNTMFIITEKIHGANVQLVFKSNGEFQQCSRNRVLSSDENFYQLTETLQKPLYTKLVDRIKQHCIINNVTLRIFGEIFGSNIQKGVEYGSDRKIRFFDIFNDNNLEWLPFIETENIFKEIEFEDMLVPNLGFCYSLREALDFDTKINSYFTPEDYNKQNLIEGIVIKPYKKIVKVEGGDIFVLKKKNDEFKENQKSDKVHKIVEFNEEVQNIRNLFFEYLTDNRLQGIFSKYGEIQKANQIGNYIKYMLEDAQNDFMKDHGEKIKDLDKNDKKNIFNCGKDIMSMLQKYL